MISDIFPWLYNNFVRNDKRQQLKECFQETVYRKFLRVFWELWRRKHWIRKTKLRSHRKWWYLCFQCLFIAWQLWVLSFPAEAEQPGCRIWSAGSASGGPGKGRRLWHYKYTTSASVMAETACSMSPGSRNARVFSMQNCWWRRKPPGVPADVLVMAGFSFPAGESVPDRCCRTVLFSSLKSAYPQWRANLEIAGSELPIARAASPIVIWTKESGFSII